MPQEVIDELARVVFEPEQARALVLRAGFPPQYLPPFTTPHDFWSAVGREVHDGSLPDRGLRLLLTAAQRYPSNRILTRAHVVMASAHQDDEESLGTEILDGALASLPCRVEISDGAKNAPAGLLLVEPHCEHAASHWWQIRLYVAFRRHRIAPGAMMKAHLAIAASGVSLVAEAESSAIADCFVDSSASGRITTVREGAMLGEGAALVKKVTWSCDSATQEGQPCGFLEGNAMLLLNYQAREGASLSTRGHTTGIVFVDASGSPIRGSLKNLALRIRLWSLGRHPEPPTLGHHEARIMLVPSQAKPEQAG